MSLLSPLAGIDMTCLMVGRIKPCVSLQKIFLCTADYQIQRSRYATIVNNIVRTLQTLSVPSCVAGVECLSSLIKVDSKIGKTYIHLTNVHGQSHNTLAIFELVYSQIDVPVLERPEQRLSETLNASMTLGNF